MNFIKKLVPKLICSILLALPVTGTFAQVAAPTTTISSPNNQLVIMMGIIMLILAFVIWGMGQVLITLGKQLLDKNKQGSKMLAIIALAGLTLLSTTINAQVQPTAGTVKAVANYGGMDSTAFWVMSTVLIIEVTIILFLMFLINRIQAELLPAKARKQHTGLKEMWHRLDTKLFTKAVAVEREADVMLDHDYDGIRELDNALPPWWKYGFMITIVVAFIYLLNFHVLGYGKDPIQEYQAEIVKAQEAKELYDAKNADKVDEAHLKMPAADGITAGKEIFNTVCWTCHGKLGEGGAGPNLTDSFWIHKGSLTDIFLTIKHGYPDKGMQAWEKNYSPKEINNIAGFIKTLEHTNPPNPKAAQGDLFIEAVSTGSLDSLNAVGYSPDSGRVKKISAGIKK